MKKIKAVNGKLYKVPVIMVISDAVKPQERRPIKEAFFAAVRYVYGAGWGRYVRCLAYISDDQPVLSYAINHRNGLFSEQKPYPIGKVYQDMAVELQQKAERVYPCRKTFVPRDIQDKREEYVLERASQMAAPILISLDYHVFSDISKELPSCEQWKLMEQIVKKFNRRGRVIDAVYVDGNHYGKYAHCSYDVAAIPTRIAHVPVRVFASPLLLTWSLIRDKRFLEVGKTTWREKIR